MLNFLRTPESGSTIGPARWMSPEVLNGGAITPSADVYSFAMTVLAVSISQFLGLFLALKWPQLLPR